MNAQQYIDKVIAEVEKRDSHEKEFIQAVKEVLHTLKPALEKNPKYIKENILERIVEPERGITFRVPWIDKDGNVQVNRGYRYQFNGAIGPYKGGIRFHPSVYSGIIKFLGFEQIFKNSLTTLPMGGGKGGSDFDPKGKTDAEIMNFCQSFMTELQRHIGPDVDVPAGDIGVGGKEIGYMYGQYRRIRGAFENGVLTGKSLESGGSLIRPEATGYGAVFFLDEMLRHAGDSIQGKTVVVSGYGNVSWGVCKKIAQLGGKVVTISGSKGYVYDPTGITTDEKIDFLLKIRNGEASMEDYAHKFGATWHAGEKPWGVKADVAIPSATQNEIDVDDVKKLIKGGVKYIVEASNMPTTNEAIEFAMSNGVVLAPGKAANAGGVATSGLEMCQNSARLSWTAEEVEAKLRQIMGNIFNACKNASEKYGLGYNLVAGANLAGFEKVAEAMIQQGRY
ncbi:NADP-specific glutamate dehydrogenase [Francisella frigiditurris]|uniref:Glutamate dehydrogenase n=1 Tax=Francisella frigiditurris TaxID=1542390 RepID=A0A1J0KU22_9GAMM|nr:NADP-specific glutamate dehydrogenase [Francisella frigiditurris]APC97187.1 NAD-specific glutamate dehydrogenase [Francisella frigiditurris]